MRETKRFGHMSKASRPSALIVRNPESVNCQTSSGFKDQIVRNIIQRYFATPLCTAIWQHILRIILMRCAQSATVPGPGEVLVLMTSSHLSDSCVVSEWKSQSRSSDRLCYSNPICLRQVINLSRRGSAHKLKINSKSVTAS